MPRYFSVLDNGRLNVQRQNVATIRDAIDKFFGDQGKYPDSLDELVSKRYLRQVPLDPRDRGGQLGADRAARRVARGRVRRAAGVQCRRRRGLIRIHGRVGRGGSGRFRSGQRGAMSD